MVPMKTSLLACLLLYVAECLPPDKMSASHIIKARSIDIFNAHGLAMETRLEKSVEPTGYVLRIEPYLDDGVFKGRVTINVTWTEDVEDIAIHCDHGIEIIKSAIIVKNQEDSKEDQIVPVKKVIMDIKKPIANLKLQKVIPKGSKGHIDIAFNGSLQLASSDGFFKSYYTEQEEEKVLAVTHLRPNNARRMFPCFDEPAYRTPFELSVVRPRNMVALSNMPVARTENITGEPDAVRDYFERSPPMSTFTLGLVIADLKQTNVEKVDGIEIRLWAVEENSDALDGVMQKVIKVYKEVSEFWKVPLPLKKIDVVALPNGRLIRTVDNWGLILFRQSDLSSGGYIQLAQEILYQWVGSFTTPVWWSDAHLNKALVSYLAAEVSLKIDNGAELEGKWPLTVLYSLYYEFSKRYPHSRITGMKQETASIKIELLFRMFNYTFGAETFRKGLRNFMESRKYKTFSGDDIWNALNNAAREEGMIPDDFSVKAAANSWIEKDRLPLITALRDYKSNSVSIHQKVYLRERPHDVPDADRLSWWAPIVMIRSDKLDFSNTIPLIWMRNKKKMDVSHMPIKEHFIIINPEEIAPFPVNYDEHNWKLLIQFLRSENRSLIPELTRAKLLHDAWNLAYAGELSFTIAFDMTLFLKEEHNHLVWHPVFTMIDHIGRDLCQCIHKKFYAYVRSLLIPLYKELLKDQREDEEYWRKNLRASAKYFLCRAGYQPCIEDAQKQYSKWMQSQTPDEGNPFKNLEDNAGFFRFKNLEDNAGFFSVSNVYFCPVFTWGTQQEWDFGLQRVLNFPPSRQKSERTFLLKTLAGCPKDETKIVKLLNISILEANSNFTETDIFLIFSMLTGSPQGYTTLFNFLATNWDVLKEKYISKSNLWDNLITSATSQFTTQEGLELVSNLYVAHQGEFGSAEHIIEKSIRNIREEAKWTAENQPVIEKWLDQYLANNKVSDD